MAISRIGIIISTTREGRFGDKPAAWIKDLAAERTDMTTELIDLRDYPLPLFDEPTAPIYKPAEHAVARRLGDKMETLDGYIFVTAEYNHGPPGALKNAIDYLYPELARKPAAFVGYGGVGAARAVEQLRLILVELHVVPLRDAVHVGLADLIAMRQEGQTFADRPHLIRAAHTMLGQLSWWARVLKQGREAQEPEAGTP